MNAVVPQERQLKIDLDVDRYAQLLEAFRAQRTNLKEGVTGLIEFFLDNPDMRPLLLNQVKGGGAEDVARGILRRGGKQVKMAAKRMRDEV